MAAIAKHEVRVRDLATHSVTLYPASARVVRAVPSLPLHQGLNQVEIHGLTPTMDESSVQIEGHGAGVSIAYMSVELVPNREIFEQAYPESDGETDDGESDDDEEDGELDRESELCRGIKESIGRLEAKTSELAERQKIANKRLEILDDYAKAAVEKAKLNGEEVADLLAKYEAERLAQFTIHTAAGAELAVVCKEIESEDKQLWRAEREQRRRQKIAKKNAREVYRSKAMRMAERNKERERVKEERAKFWPKKLYRVTLGLEVPVDTPASSRKGSTADGSSQVATLVQLDPEETGVQVELMLSYVTREAFWTPRHDIAISSTDKTATIRYHAEFINKTSEVWADAKVSLCSSQTNFSGVNDDAPTLEPWKIRLSKTSTAADSAMTSIQERHGSSSRNIQTSRVNRADIFGLNSLNVPLEKPSRTRGRSAKALHSQLSVPWGLRVVTVERARGVSDAKLYPGGLEPHDARANYDSEDEDMGFGLFDGAPATTRETTRLAYEGSTWEDDGLTSTYELPGVRTLEPSSHARRYTIATLQATGVELWHTAVPKLRTAAFLNASIRNPSGSITVLPGALAITLDATFLGTAKLPRVAPNQTFNLSLGVDPTVHISYTRNPPHRSTAGMLFSKETALRFCREIWLRNTRNSAITLRVMDQVPESRDERLRVEVLAPAGLHQDGQPVRAGVAASASGRPGPLGGAGGSQHSLVGGTSSWGKATATMQKDGEVSWKVTLEKGAAGLLTLEYETRLPSQEGIESA